MTIRQKLTASHAGIIIAFMIMVGLMFSQLYSFQQETDSLIENNQNRLTRLSDIAYNQDYHRRIVIASLMVSKKRGDNYISTSEDLRKTIDTELSELMELTARKDLVGAYRDAWNAYLKKSDRIIEYRNSGNAQAAYQIIDESADDFIKMGEQFAEMKRINVQISREKVQEMNDTITNKILIFGGMTLLIILGAIFATYRNVKYIDERCRRIIVAIDTLAKGDFSETGRTVTENDEFGTMADSAAAMRTAVRDLIRNIIESAETVASSSEELNASADQSAQVTQIVAQSINEIANKGEEQSKAIDRSSEAVGAISANIQEVSANVNVANDYAIRTQQIALDGDKAVKLAISQMSDIETVVSNSATVVNELGERSKEISQIVESITSIASQTSLLSLNAAIEAARAGEQGRGFAVVAEEVRKLANESELAAENIRELITAIQSKTENAVDAMQRGTDNVKQGAEIVQQSGRSFHDILEISTELARQVDAINNSTEEIAASASNVIETIRTVDDNAHQISEQSQNVSAAAQQQSASIEEIAYSSQSLSGVAQSLNELVGKFKV